jgi:hypothetical protein
MFSPPALIGWRLPVCCRLYCFSVDKTAEGQAPKIHLGWVLVLALSGLLITALAFGGRFVSGINEGDLAVWQSILTNFGVGMLSAAVLLLFEPKFRKVVSDTVTTATAGVKEEVREAVQADIDERLAPLTDRIDSLYDAKLASQQALAKDLASNFTHERVVKLFQEAAKLSALANQSITVQGEAEPGKLLIQFQLRLPDELSGIDIYTGERAGPEHEALHVAVYPKERRLRAEVIWEPATSFADVAIELAEELNFMRARGLAEKINWGPILTRIEQGIDVAIHASMKTPDALPLEGPLIQFLDGKQGWYLTTEGLHCPEHDYTLPSNYFYKSPIQRATAAQNRTVDPPLDAPVWADKAEWAYMFREAKSAFTPNAHNYF